MLCPICIRIQVFCAGMRLIGSARKHTDKFSSCVTAAPGDASYVRLWLRAPRSLSEQGT